MKELIGNLALLPPERLLNALVQQDPFIQSKLSPYSGKAIQVNATSPSLHLRIAFDSNEIRLSAVDSEAYQLPVDATVTAPASVLIKRTLMESTDAPLVNSDVKLSGDTQLIQDLFNSLKSLDIDWQDYLAPVLGDLATYQLGETLSASGRWARDSGRRMQSSFNDYLKEEAGVLPHPLQVQNFSADLDQLKLRIDRLQARVSRIEGGLQVLTTDTRS